MRDEMEARMWDRNHQQFSRDLDRLFEKIAVVFRKLAKIEFDAPWEIKEKRR